MKKMLACIGMVLCFAIAAENGYADDPKTIDGGLPNAILNSDCVAPLIKTIRGVCHSECLEDRDCGGKCLRLESPLRCL